MILDVPTSDELTQAGTNLLNLAWATDQPYRQISSSMRIRSQPGLAGRGVCASKLGDALAKHDAMIAILACCYSLGGCGGARAGQEMRFALDVDVSP